MTEQRLAVLLAVEKICEIRRKEMRMEFASPSDVADMIEMNYGAVKVQLHRLRKEGLLEQPKRFRGLYKLTNRGKEKIDLMKSSFKSYDEKGNL